MNYYITRNTILIMSVFCINSMLYVLPLHAAGTNYNTTYVNGVKTITLPVETAEFTPGPNVELVEHICTSCHSADYPTTQPYQDRTGWHEVVEKMHHVFHMDALTITDEDLIVDYLTTYYGK